MQSLARFASRPLQFASARGRAGSHGFADAERHEPGRAIGDVHGPVELVSREAPFGRAIEPEAEQPAGAGDLRPLEDCPDPSGELAWGRWPRDRASTHRVAAERLQSIDLGGLGQRTGTGRPQ